MEILEITIVTVDSKKTTARWKTGKPCVRWFAIIGKVRSPKPRTTRQCRVPELHRHRWSKICAWSRHQCRLKMMASWSSRYSLFWNIALTFKLRQVPPRYSGLQSLLSCPHGVVIHARWKRMAWRNWYDQRWEGWNGGKSMHGVKHSWSGTAIVPRDNENNSHITESMCQRSNETFAILSASIRTFYEWTIFSALKKLMDIRWIANIGSSAWELSWLETSSPQFTEKTIAIRSMYRGIFQYRDVSVF